MEKESIENLLKLEKFYRQKGNQIDSLDTSIEILKKIETSSSKYQQEILTKLIVHKTQSLFVIIGIYVHIITNKLFSLSVIEKEECYNIFQSALLKIKDPSQKNKLLKESLLKIFQKYKVKDSEFFKEIEKEILDVSKLMDITKNRFATVNKISGEVSDSKGSYMAFSENSLMNSNNNLNLVNTSSASMVKLNPDNQINYQIKKFNDGKNNTGQNKIQMNSEQSAAIKKYKPNNSLPFILFDFTATLSSGQIATHVTQVFEKMKFKKVCTIKESSTEVISVYEENIKNKCICCLFRKPISQFYINVSYGSKNNITNDKYEKKIYLRSIKGNEARLQNKILKFLSLMSKSINKFKILKISKNLNISSVEKIINSSMVNKNKKLFKSKGKNNLFSDTSKNLKYNQLPEQDISCSNTNIIRKSSKEFEDSIVEASNKHANKLLDIFKILSKSDYDLGKSINEFIACFKDQYKSLIQNINEISTKSIMAKIVNQIDDCVTTFNTSFNSNNRSPINNINIKYSPSSFNNVYIGEAAEKFIFNKIYFMLIELYKAKYKNEDIKFTDQKNKILFGSSVDDIFKHLGIKKKFRGEDAIPFKISIDLINKIQFEQSPKKKFENVLKSNLEMRNNILEFSKGKVEVESMDDELPLTIYLVTQVSINYLASELHMVEDYIQCVIKDDIIQNKNLTNLISAVSYISNSWDEEE